MKIEKLAGSGDFEQLATAAPWRAFDDRVLCFLAALSDRLHRHPLAIAHIDVIGLAFFCRRTNIETLRTQHLSRCESAVGRGLSFHIAPSNVPINFAYSMILGLLSGNTCIVRASSKDFMETAIVCEEINRLLSNNQFHEFADRLSIVRYGHDRSINDYFSNLCDLRLIWGGDNTVAEIRASQLPPRSVEVVFADRYSICLIDAAGYLEVAEKRETAIGFYNDTYRNHQAACTAPRLVYWLGSEKQVAAAQPVFWRELDEVLVEKGEFSSAIDTVEKFAASCRLALAQPTAHAERRSNLNICRMEVTTLDDAMTRIFCDGGFFVEYQSESLDALRANVTTRFQTVTYIGLPPETIARDVAFAGVKGIDRVVPNGKASEFSLYWDGYDLMVNLTRHITVV